MSDSLHRDPETEPRDLEQLRFAVDLLRETFMVAEHGYLFNDLRDGVELAEKLGLKPRIAVGEGDRKVDLIRNPITFSEGEISYDLPPPQLGEHSDEIRKWLKETQG